MTEEVTLAPDINLGVIWRSAVAVANDYHMVRLTHCVVRNIAGCNVALFYRHDNPEVPFLAVACVLLTAEVQLGLEVLVSLGQPLPLEVAEECRRRGWGLALTND